MTTLDEFQRGAATASPLDTLRGQVKGPTFAGVPKEQGLMEGLQATGKGLLSPAAAAPIAIGEGQRAAMAAQDERDRMFGKRAAEKEQEFFIWIYVSYSKGVIFSLISMKF